jgi:predicted ArsR family transcriptional regulator
LRQPVLTARGLAERLRISPRAALGLLDQLVADRVLREATGGAAWRAFVVM